MNRREIVGNRIRKLREYKGLSQRELSGQLGNGISNKQISYWENGEREIHLDDLATLSCYFGVTTDYLLGVSDYPNYKMQSKAREIDLTAEVCEESFTNDKNAVRAIDYLFEGIAREINAWEREEQAGYVQYSGAISLFEYFVALMDCIRENNDPWGKHEEKNSRLNKLLNNYREYIGDIVLRSFNNEELSKMIKGRLDAESLEWDVRDIFDFVWRR